MIFSHVKVIQFPADTPEIQGGITKQGKTYIILEEDEACFVKTVYKSKISYNKLKLN